VRGAASNGRPYRDSLSRPRKWQCGCRPSCHLGDGSFDLPVNFGIARRADLGCEKCGRPGSTFHFVLPIAMEPTGE
jgi:hypothetical protein